VKAVKERAERRKQKEEERLACVAGSEVAVIEVKHVVKRNFNLINRGNV